jgi:hypothetical protein
VITDDSHYISAEEKMEKVLVNVRAAFSSNSVNIGYLPSLIERIKEDNHNYARGQLLGLACLAKRYPTSCWHAIEQEIFALPKVKISALDKLLKISHYDVQLSDIHRATQEKEPSFSSLDRSLSVYMKVLDKGAVDA